MSDIAPEVAPAVESAPAEAAPDVAPAAEADPFDTAETTQFDRGYVTKLRDEAAKHRTAYTPYKEAFGGYSPEEQAVWFDLAKGLSTDPRATAAKFQEIAKAILGDGEPATPPAPAADADKPLTQAELEAKFAERDQAQQVRDITARIEAEATTLGYEKGTPKWRELMFNAQYETNGDLTKAHANLEANKQAVIDAYVAGKDGPKLPQNGGTPPAQGEPITSFASASDAFRAAINAM